MISLLETYLRPESKPLGAKLTRNVLFNAMRVVLLGPLQLIMIPFYLNKLGTGGYGTWAILLAISGASSIADVGIVTTLSKHVAEFYALKDFSSLSRFINTGWALHLAIAGLLSGLLYAGFPFFQSTLLRTSAVPASELRILWRHLIVLLFANTVILLFSSIVNGLQRMDLSTAIGCMNLILSAGLSVMFLGMNLGLRGILYAYLIAGWMSALAYILVVRRLLPQVELNPLRFRLDVAGEILSFSMKTYITQISVVVQNQTEKILLAHYVGVAPVGWYDIASELALKMRGIPSLILSPVMPAASELHAIGDQKRLSHLYQRAHKYLAVIGVPLVLYVALQSRSFVELWVGKNLVFLALPLSLLLAVNLLNLTTGPGLLVLIAAGDLNPGLYSAVSGIVLNLSLSLLLIRAYGFRGAVVGTTFAMSVASIFFLCLFRRTTHASFPRVMGLYYAKPLACSATLGLILWNFNRGASLTWSRLTTETILFGTVYFALLLLFRFFDAFDLAIGARLVPIPRAIRRMIPDVELGGTLLSDCAGAKTTVV